MSPRTELTLFERGEIIGAWKCGVSETKIAECLNRAPSTIHKVIVAYRDFGQEKPSPRSGRPKIITPRDSYAVKKVLQEKKKLGKTLFQAHLQLLVKIHCVAISMKLVFMVGLE